MKTINMIHVHTKIDIKRLLSKIRIRSVVIHFQLHLVTSEV